MSTNRSKDRSSLCSFMFVDGRRCRIPRRAGHPYLCAFHAVICSGGSSDPPARWPRAHLSPFRQLSVRMRSQLRPRTPLLRRRPRPRQTQNRLHPSLSRPNACKSCPSPKTNTSTPTTPIPGAKPSASPTNSPPSTRRLSPHRQLPNRNQIRPQPCSRDAIRRISRLGIESTLTTFRINTCEKPRGGGQCSSLGFGANARQGIAAGREEGVCSFAVEL